MRRATLLLVAAVTIAAVAFAVPLVPMAIWYVTHPEQMRQVVGAYELGKSVAATGATVGAGLTSVKKALSLYWSFFSPEYLFLLGDPSLINSTRHTGLFPLSFALLIPFGVWHLARRRRELDLVVLAGLVTAPVAAVASGAIEMNRVMFVVPFGALVAVYGVEWLLTAARRGGGLLACALADPECAGLLPGAQRWQPIHVVSELDGTRSFALFEAR